MKKRILSLVVALMATATGAQAQMKALIIDGQNNHSAWPKTTIMMKQYLEETGLFTVDIVRMKYTWWYGKARAADWLPYANVGETEHLEEPKADPDFKPDFKQYAVVISNLGNRASDWPNETKTAFVEYMKNGGGFVVVHAADNSYGNWAEFNDMIGLGGWGGRKEGAGPYVYYTNEGELKRDDSPGRCGKHGRGHNIPITLRVKDHPITQGLPNNWVTAKDECYALLRGPAENMTILATGKDMSDKAPTDRHEPMLMVLDYGKGRIFHSTLGHDDKSMSGVGFITTFLRGTEWAATGKVTIPVPKDFPAEGKQSSRKFVRNK